MKVTKRCQKCQALVAEGFKFCPYCGEPPPANRCKQCQQELNSDYEFCPHCGIEIDSNSTASGATKCPTCGRDNLEGEQVCRGCGVSLRGSTATPREWQGLDSKIRSYMRPGVASDLLRDLLDWCNQKLEWYNQKTQELAEAVRPTSTKQRKPNLSADVQEDEVEAEAEDKTSDHVLALFLDHMPVP